MASCRADQATLIPVLKRQGPGIDHRLAEHVGRSTIKTNRTGSPNRQIIIELGLTEHRQLTTVQCNSLQGLDSRCNSVSNLQTKMALFDYSVYIMLYFPPADIKYVYHGPHSLSPKENNCCYTVSIASGICAV